MAATAISGARPGGETGMRNDKKGRTLVSSERANMVIGLSTAGFSAVLPVAQLLNVMDAEGLMAKIAGKVLGQR